MERINKIKQELLSYKRMLEINPSERFQSAIKEKMQELCKTIGTNLESFIQDLNVKPHAFCGEQTKRRATRSTNPDLKIPQRDLLEMKGDQRKFLTKNSCMVCKKSYEDVLVNGYHLVKPPCGHILCCECAERTINNNKARRNSKCPSCNSRVAVFEDLKFGVDFKIKPGQNVFCDFQVV